VTKSARGQTVYYPPDAGRPRRPFRSGDEEFATLSSGSRSCSRAFSPTTDQEFVRSSATMGVLRRQRADAVEPSRFVASWAYCWIRAALQFLAGSTSAVPTLDAVGQADVDQWLTGTAATRAWLHDLMGWVCTRRLAPKVGSRPTPDRSPNVFSGQRALWVLACGYSDGRHARVAMRLG
jgi:hypothetical protein